MANSNDIVSGSGDASALVEKASVACANDCAAEIKLVSQMEILNLPDVVAPALHHRSTGIADRVHEQRRAHHDLCVRSMRQELAAIASASAVVCRRKIDVVADALRQLEASIAECFQGLDDAELLVQHTIGDMTEIWSNIEARQSQFRELLDDEEQQCLQLECDRVRSISAIVRRYNEALCNRSHLLQNEVQAFIERESLFINQVYTYYRVNKI